MKNGVIIVAGGSGKRFGGEVPKQFLLLNGKPVLMHTIERFAEALQQPEIVVVLPELYRAQWQELCRQHAFNVPHSTVAGGEERYYSVVNGLKKLGSCELIGVHDGVRPLVSAALIRRCYDTASRHGSCVPVISISDSLRAGNFHNNRRIQRETVYRVQTPQVFREKWLIDAYSLPYQYGYTDDASVMETAGYPIILTEGEPENIKITQSEDLPLAAFYHQQLNS